LEAPLALAESGRRIRSGRISPSLGIILNRPSPGLVRRDQAISIITRQEKFIAFASMEFYAERIAHPRDQTTNAGSIDHQSLCEFCDANHLSH
jgi:hypothetical protein